MNRAGYDQGYTQQEVEGKQMFSIFTNWFFKWGKRIFSIYN
jgi:hypothetical protein